MKRLFVPIAGICGIIVIIFLWYTGTYSGLVAVQEEVNNTWGQVQNQYQRRADLIPNLVATVKGYAGHENQTLVEVTKARQQVMSIRLDGVVTNAALQKQFIEAQQSLSGALTRLLAVKESYPDLKANQSFLDLQTQLEGTENRIAVERKRYQDAITRNNKIVRGFFSSFVAQRNGFTVREYYSAQVGAERAPTVTF
jgi:LemA protein